MIRKTLVFVCATFTLVAGTSLETSHLQGLFSSCTSPIAAIPSPAGCNNFLPCGASFPLSGFGLGTRVGLGLPITDGRCGSPVTVAESSSITLPTVETPVISLPSQPIFSPRVISQRCICTKTEVKPQIYQRLVTVPKIQRYLKRSVSPIVENVAYKATPISQRRMGSVAAASRPVYSSSVVVSEPATSCSC